MVKPPVDSSAVSELEAKYVAPVSLVGGIEMSPAEARGILGLSPEAGLDELQDAYKKRSRFMHPDRFGGRPESEIRFATAEFQRLTNARDMLREVISGASDSPGDDGSSFSSDREKATYTGGNSQGTRADTFEEGPNDARRTWLGLGRGAIGLATIVVAVLAAFVLNGTGSDRSEHPSAENVSPGGLVSGACLQNWEDVNSNADVVTCETPHDAQLVATDSFGEDEAFPGTSALAARVNEVCAAVDYADATADFPDLKLTKSIPTEKTWANGDRRVDCFVFTPDQKLRQSLLNE